MAFSPDGARLATASTDKTARLWDAARGDLLLECEGHRDAVEGVAFSPDGARLATASWDGTARLWDARTGRSLLECKGHSREVLSVVFSPDGKHLATASHDQTARVWDAETGKELLVCKGHTHFVTSVAFSPDGARLATGSQDRTARLWDAGTGQPLLELKGHAETVTGVAFTPDGMWLATASEDRTVRLWDARRVPLPAVEEFAYRVWATRPEPDWHEGQFKKVQNVDHFAAAFHLDRLLAYAPARRTELLRQRTAFLEAALKQDPQNAAARLLLARTAWHSPALGPKDTAGLLLSADEKGLLQRRARAGLLLRQQKPDEAVAVLEGTLKERGEDKPPAEELLLAWAYLDTKQTDKAARAVGEGDGLAGPRARGGARGERRRGAAGRRPSGSGGAAGAAGRPALRPVRLGDVVRDRRAAPRVGPALQGEKTLSRYRSRSLRVCPWNIRKVPLRIWPRPRESR